MTSTSQSAGFYATVPLSEDFSAFSKVESYTPLPDDWYVGTADITGSTKAVAEGRYKTVNMVSAAVISAQMNAHEGAAFPFVFGGDGAGFAVPAEWRVRASHALAAVQIWAQEEFGIDLRIGMVSVADIRAAGRDITVARFQASKGADYAMFSGGGLLWAETQMKAGAHAIERARAGTQPDLTGLSCRWQHMPSTAGVILSVVIAPTANASAAAFGGLSSQVIDMVSTLSRAGHPLEQDGPGVTWPPDGATLEAHAQRGGGSLGRARRKALFESFMAWILIKTGLKLGGFDARRYRRVVGQNADFRKFDDGLKMTLDCDADTQERLRAMLEQARAEGIIHYGLHAQSEAMITCIVPSILSDDHVHFVDGATGGYTAAAQQLKAK